MIKVEDLYPLMLEAFAEDKHFVLPIKGMSMQPMLHNGDTVELIKLDEIRKNDIIFYRRTDGSFVLHRVYKIEENSFTMVGDHQTLLEKGITRDQCFAKVISYTKQNKKKKELKGLRYRMYLFSLKFFLIRKIYMRYF